MWERMCSNGTRPIRIRRYCNDAARVIHSTREPKPLGNVPTLLPNLPVIAMTSRFFLFFTFGALIGCTQSTESEEALSSPEPDSVVVAGESSGLDTLVITDSSRVSGAVTAESPVRVEGACPFECCTYTTWTTSGETTVFAEADNIHSSDFTVPADTELEADRGHVTVRRPGRVAVRAEIDPDQYWGLDVTSPGDTLVVLDYIGEGHFHFWLQGEIHEGMLPGAPDAWTEPETEDLDWLEQPVTEWWAHVTLADGREGWLWMEHTPQVYGADACG